MDEKFYLTSSGRICPFCKSDNIRILGKSKYKKNDNIVKCINCDVVMFESDLDEEEEENEKFKMIEIICPKHKNISKIVPLRNYKYIENIIKKYGKNAILNKFWFCKICGKRLRSKNKEI